MKKILRATILGITALVASVFVFPQNVEAESKTASIKASVEETLSLTLSANAMNFNLETSELYTDFINVTGRTNSAGGYTISFNANNDYNDLKHSNPLVEDLIASIPGSRDESSFPEKSWGYSTDQTDYTFKKIPLSPKNIFITAEPGEVTNKFTTGIKGSADLPAGDYENELIFTIVANPITDPNTDEDYGDNSENPEPLVYDEYGRAKAILGANGNLNFVFDTNTYNVGEIYTDNLGTTEIAAVYNVPLNASVVSWNSNAPWASNIENITSVNFAESFYNFKPTKTSGWFNSGSNITSLTNPQNLNTSETWSMSYMFQGTKIASFDLRAWDVSNVININSMFQSTYPTSFSLNVTGWDTSKLATASNTFGNAGASYGTTKWEIIGIEDWNVSNLKIARNMFLCAGWYAPNFYLDLSNWDVSNIKDAYWMFEQAAQDATDVYINLSNWDLDNATDMTRFMNSFAMNANKATIIMDNFSANSVTNLDSAFSSMAAERSNTADNELNFSMQNFQAKNLQSARFAFSYLGSNAKNINMNIDSWNISNTTDLYRIFMNAGYATEDFTMSAKNWRVGTNMSNVFDTLGYSAINFSLDLTGWDTSKVEQMDYAFYYTGYGDYNGNNESWELIGIEDWDVSSVENFDHAFAYLGANASTLNLDLHKWNTSNATNVQSMFNSVGYNKSGTVNLDLRNLDFSNADTLNGIFSGPVGCKAQVLNMNLSNWNLGTKITSLGGLFSSVGSDAGDVTINVSGWDTSHITDMQNTFNWAGKHANSFNIIGVNDWSVSGANTEGMFSNAGTDSGFVAPF